MLIWTNKYNLKYSTCINILSDVLLVIGIVIHFVISKTQLISIFGIIFPSYRRFIKTNLQMCVILNSKDILQLLFYTERDKHIEIGKLDFSTL